MSRISFSRYVWASIRWIVWQLVAWKAIEAKATRRVRRADGLAFDPWKLETQARIYSARLDIEDEQFKRFLGTSRDALLNAEEKILDDFHKGRRNR